jgi:hypothetical protein
MVGGESNREITIYGPPRGLVFPGFMLDKRPRVTSTRVHSNGPVECVQCVPNSSEETEPDTGSPELPVAFGRCKEYPLGMSSLGKNIPEPLGASARTAGRSRWEPPRAGMIRKAGVFSHAISSVEFLFGDLEGSMTGRRWRLAVVTTTIAVAVTALVI